MHTHRETLASLINCVIDDTLLKIDARHRSGNPETQHYDLRDSATGNLEHRSIECCEKYFDILNRLDVDHECDGQTDGQTDRQSSPSAIARYNIDTRSNDCCLGLQRCLRLSFASQEAHQEIR